MNRQTDNTESGTGSTGGEPAGGGIIRLDADLVVVSLTEGAGALLDRAPDLVLGRRIDELADLANLGNLMRNHIGFSNQVIVAGSRRLACDFVPISEAGSGVVGGLLTLLRLLPDPHPDSSDDLKDLLRSAADFMNLDYDGIVVVDGEGIVVLVNQAFADMLDTTPQALIGKHVLQAYPNSQPSRLPMVMETGKPQIGITHYLNGKQVYASLFPLKKGGQIIGGLGKILFKDVRELPLIVNRLQGLSAPRRPSSVGPARQPLFRYDLDSIVGQCGKMVELKNSVVRVAQKNSNVLVLGESGTGKELFAHAIHAASKRRYAPFVKVNCAAIPEHLLESELFGYAEGAFTGAKKGGLTGKFEQAHSGTIFLDEIGDMPLYMQSKMLRVLQEKEISPLGSAAPRMVDVRVVAATNCNLEQLVREGRFRQDLYYRLNVVTLVIPPLRERMEDLAPIVATFVEHFNAEFGLQVQGLDAEAWGVIRRYDWPGNIRELRNVIESAFNAVNGPLILKEHLPDQLSLMVSRAGDGAGLGMKAYFQDLLGRKDLGAIMDQLEQLVLETALEASDGNKLRAAQLLGISRQWLYKKLHKHDGAD